MLDGDQDSKPKGGHLLRGGDHTRKFLSNEMDGVRGQGRRIHSKATSVAIPPTSESAASNAAPKVDRKRARREEKEEKKRAKREEKEKEAAEKARARKDAEERERFKRTELKKREKLEKQINAASETTKRLRLDLEALKSSSSTTDHADKIKERDVEIQRLNKTILRLQQCASTPNTKSNSPVISCSSVSPSNDPSILGLLSSLIEQRNHVPMPLSVAPTPLRPVKGRRNSTPTPTPAPLLAGGATATWEQVLTLLAQGHQAAPAPAPAAPASQSLEEALRRIMGASASAPAPAPVPAPAPTPAPAAPTSESLEEALRRMIGASAPAPAPAPAPTPAPLPCLASTLASILAAR